MSKMPKSNYSASRAFGKDALSYIPSQVIPAIISFFAIAVYTRLLNPEQYGQYTLVIVTVSIVFSTFGWLNQAGIRYFEEYKKKGLFVQFTSTAFISLFASLIIVLFMWYGITLFLKEAWHTDFIGLIQIGGIVLATQTVYLFILVLLRAGRRSFKYSLYTILNSLGTFLGAIFFIKFAGFGPEGILLAMTIFLGGIALFELSNFLRNHLISISSYSTDLLKRFALYGIPMIGVSIGTIVISISDRYIIQYFMGTEAVGIYSAGYGFAGKSIQGISGILMLAALPVIFQTFTRKGEKETSVLLGRLISIYFIILVPVIFGVGILSKEIVGVILGKSFRDSYIILPWVTGGIFCHGLGLYPGITFQLKEKTKFLFWIYAFAATINIALNFFWIPMLGIIGAAYATLIAYFIYLVITWMFGVKLFRFIFPRQTLWKVILAAIVMVFVLKVVFSGAAIGIVPLISKIILGVLVYFVSLGILKERIFLDSLKFGGKHLRALSMKKIGKNE